MTAKLLAAEALVKSIRTGEHSAAVVLEPYLDENVVLETNGPMPGAPTDTVRGRADVLRRESGNWAVTVALRHARWTSPVDEGGVVKVNDVRTPRWRGACGARSRFRSAMRTVSGSYSTPRLSQPSTSSAGRQPLINNARTNETRLVAHTDESGNPVLTFRGSIQVWNDTALCAWIRQASGGLVRSLAKNPSVSLAYRDGPRAMLLMGGRARIDTDDALRKRVFEMIPESEQNHDPAHKGAAMIIEIDRMQGFSTGGEPVRMARKT